MPTPSLVLGILLGVLLASASDAPLVMENSDHMEGFRGKGEVILTGHVRFRHGNLRFETERAIWQKDLSRVTCEAGMRLTQGGARLTADRGSYDKSRNQALAQGHVVFRDSGGEMEGDGERLAYDRVRHEAVLSGRPRVRRLYPGDSVSGKDPDTLTIRAVKLRYNDSANTAEARESVVITRKNLHITCGRAEYLRKVDSLYLSEDPNVRADENEVKGTRMRLGLHGEELRGLWVQGKAEAQSEEKATDSTRARKSRVQGDSLFMAFRAGVVESVQVFHRALGTYFDVDKPQYVNRMGGDYMVLRFRDKQVRNAEVLGSARSTYYHFENDSLKGTNLADGDSINFAFRGGKIDEVLVRGRARGTYLGRGLEKPAGRGKP